jgi:prepilin-type processing-associated H-X9-DG protein
MYAKQFRPVDLVTVFSVVAVAGVLLSPSILQARATARGASCRDKFKMLGLALHNYHDAHGIFPPGRVWDANPARNPHDTSTALLLAPFLEEVAVYNQYNTRVGAWIDPANKTVRERKLEIFLCPDDVGTTATAKIDPSGAPTNIAFSLGGTAWATHASAGKGPEPDGVFFDNSGVRVQNILDGTSVTVVASEQLIDRARVEGSAARTGDCSGSDVEGKQFYQRTGSRWISGNPSSAYFNARRRPNDSGGDCFHGIPIAGIGFLNKAARSKHEGGVHALFGDGHVQFVRNEIDSEVWRAVNTRAGREIVDPNGF